MHGWHFDGRPIASREWFHACLFGIEGELPWGAITTALMSAVAVSNRNEPSGNSSGTGSKACCEIQWFITARSASAFVSKSASATGDPYGPVSTSR
jgi:hypothetical protein